jgi:nucleoside phosphorylase
VEPSQARKIGLVFPTNLELQPFLALMPELKQDSKHPWQTYSASWRHLELTAIVSYIGPANVAAATERLLAKGHQMLLHGGAAGAMNSALMPGDIVLGQHYKILCSRPILEARRTLLLSNKAVRYSKNGEGIHLEQLDGSDSLLQIAESAGKSLPTAFPSWQAGGWPTTIPSRRPQISRGTLGSQDGWTKGADELQYIIDEFEVDTEDMESAYVAQIAAKYEAPLLTVRCISNNEHIATLAKEEIFPAVKEAAARAAHVMFSTLSQLAAAR